MQGTAIVRKPKSFINYGNISQFFRKKYLQNGFTSIIMVRHGLLPIVIYTTHPVIVPPSVRKNGQCEMIGVEDKTKGENQKWLSYL